MNFKNTASALLLIISLILPSKAHVDFHAFHISKTDIEYKAQEKTLQITSHIFIDDLELALEKRGLKGLFIGTEKENKEANKHICQYLFDNFSIKINNKTVYYEVLGKETTQDRQALYIYMEIKNIKDMRNIFVENKVLTECFNDQKNIVQISTSSKKQGYFLLDKTKMSDSAQF